MKKLIAAMLVLACFVSLTSCSGNAGTSSSTPPASSKGDQVESSEPEVAQTNEFGWVMPEETIKFAMYKGQQNPEELAERIKELQPWILENFNVDIECQVFDLDMSQKLNLMLSAGDYPEVITNIGEDTVLNFIKMNKAIDLAPYMDTIGKDIKAGMEEWGVYETFFNEEGKFFALPTYYGYVNEPDYAAFLRYDYWKEMGEPAYETTEDYYNLLKDMVAQHPTNDAGEKAYAISFTDMGTGGTNVIINTVGGAWGLKEGYKQDADNTFTYWTNTEEGYEMLAYLNRFYREGLMDPDAFVNKYADWQSKFSTDRILGGFGSWWHCWNSGHEIWKQTKEDWNEENRAVQISVKAPGVEQATMTAKSARGYGVYTVLTDKAKDPEGILKWINFTNTEIGRWIPAYGIPNTENSLWTYTDGQPEFAEGPKQDLLNETFDWNTQLWPTGAQSLHLCGNLEGVRGNNTSYYYDHAFTDQMTWWKVMIENTADSIYDATIQKQIVVEQTSDLGTIKQRVSDAVITGFAQCVMSATEGDLRANFDNLAATLNELGVNQLEEYMTSEYARLSGAQG